MDTLSAFSSASTDVRRKLPLLLAGLVATAIGTLIPLAKFGPDFVRSLSASRQAALFGYLVSVVITIGLAALGLWIAARIALRGVSARSRLAAYVVAEWDRGIDILIAGIVVVYNFEHELAHDERYKVDALFWLLVFIVPAWALLHGLLDRLAEDVDEPSGTGNMWLIRCVCVTSNLLCLIVTSFAVGVAVYYRTIES